jgi:hypothetical protein
MAEVKDNLARYRERIGRAPEAPAAGGRRAAHVPAHGLTGTDEAGSGGDD